METKRREEKGGVPVEKTTGTTKRRRFTVEEFHKMGETGILRPDERVELVDGEVLEMSPIG